MLGIVERALSGVAALCVIGLCLVITGTVVSRWLLGWGIPDDVTIVQELMIGAIILPLAYVTSSRSHIAVEVLYNRLGRRTQIYLMAFGTAFGFLALLPLTYAAWHEFVYAYESETYFFGDLELPEWPGKMAFFVGLFFFVLRLCLLTASDLKAAWRAGSSAGHSGKV
ncbi:TRAP transporter small permease [Pelagibius sp. Alg239-R121]|uniref:TRAP transporter small permease n=1 Tax=Pelagibius sp. Alg239-R121 TaxID=2993448 RepID=UPI0024A720A7|nr:TRAP transporter small permease [Pelagibius sp. Alg239-R121]